MVGYNEWELRTNAAAVGQLAVNFDNGTGTLQYQGHTSSLTRFRTVRSDGFRANFYAGRFSGVLVGYIAGSGALSVDFFLDRGGKYSLTGKRIGVIGMTPVEETTHRFKGTYDIAAVAHHLWQYDGVRGQPFVWSSEEADLFNSSSNRNELLSARRMCCYEFVEYCGYLCGQQSAPTFCGMSPGVLYSSGMDRAGQYPVWDWSSLIPRGKVVIGIATGFNNVEGYYHAGISLGGGQIVSLRSGKNLSLDFAGAVFQRPCYSRVVYADCPWHSRRSATVVGEAAAARK